MKFTMSQLSICFCKVIRIPELAIVIRELDRKLDITSPHRVFRLFKTQAKKFLLAKIQNPELLNLEIMLGIRDPANDKNPESQFH